MYLRTLGKIIRCVITLQTFARVLWTAGSHSKVPVDRIRNRSDFRSFDKSLIEVLIQCNIFVRESSHAVSLLLVKNEIVNKTFNEDHRVTIKYLYESDYVLKRNDYMIYVSIDRVKSIAVSRYNFFYVTD